MKTRGVQLQYRFVAASQRGAEVHNPLFELLAAVCAQGSIQRAAAVLELSYRHVWGALKQWEAEIGEPLVSWRKGQPARLSPFAICRRPPGRRSCLLAQAGLKSSEAESGAVTLIR